LVVKNKLRSFMRQVFAVQNYGCQESEVKKAR